MRTSLTHPLRIDEMDCQPYAPGVVGITLCPGKCGDSVYGAPYALLLHGLQQQARDGRLRAAVVATELGVYYTLAEMV